MFLLKYSVVTILVIILNCVQLLHTSATTTSNNISSEKHVNYDNPIIIHNFNDSNNSTPKIVINLLNESRKLNHRACAYMNVSHNSSYTIYDREDFSEGLENIHKTTSIFEEFYNIILQPGCEATICELVLLDPVARSRKCYNFNESRDLTLDAGKAADPATRNYFVSTGCSCKEPSPGCNNSTKCNSIHLKEGECAKLYKENSCSECRYDALVLKELESSFIPNNGFWCESYVIRDGCRLSIDSINENGTTISNFANYSGISSNISLNYIRKPTPPKFTCICDLEETDSVVSQTEKTWIISFAVGIIAILSVISSTLVLKKCIRIRVEKKISSDQFEHLIQRFRNGFSKEEIISLSKPSDITNDQHSNNGEYVSTGYLNAVQQPYQHKWEISRERIILEHQIGIGEFGVVYLAKLFNDSKKSGVGIQVAGKVPKLKNISCFNSVLEEIKVWSYIGEHKNVCKFIGAITEDIPRLDALIILEYCSEKNLKDYLKKHRNTFLEPLKMPEINSNPDVHYVVLSSSGEDATIESSAFCSRILMDKFKQLLKWAAQIASEWNLLAQNMQVVHVDLAARNIFLDASLECKIGDFGLSQRLYDVVNYVRIAEEHRIPFRWLALESLTDLRFTTFSDVWSYAITLYEIFSLGDDPYAKSIGFSDLVQMLKDGKRLEKPLHCSDEIYRTMLKCWDVDTMKRPSFEDLKHLFQEKTNTTYEQKSNSPVI